MNDSRPGTYNPLSNMGPPMVGRNKEWSLWGQMARGDWELVPTQVLVVGFLLPLHEQQAVTHPELAHPAGAQGHLF